MGSAFSILSEVLKGFIDMLQSLILCGLVILHFLMSLVNCNVPEGNRLKLLYNLRNVFNKMGDTDPFASVDVYVYLSLYGFRP